MLASLSSRIVALTAVVMAALVALACLLSGVSAQTETSFRWAAHSGEVIETMDATTVAMREAEAGQRGFILTRRPEFAATVDEELRHARSAVARVVELTADNPVQNRRARELQVLIARRLLLLEANLARARGGDFDGAVEAIASGRGRELMETVALRTETFLDEEHELSASRTATAVARLADGRQLAMAGLSAISVMVLVVLVTLVRGIRRPVRILRDAMDALGRGERGRRIVGDMHSREFGRLAQGLNAMADELEAAVVRQGASEQELQAANAELLRSSAVLKERGEAIELLGGMAHRMQAAATDEELAQVIQVFAPRVLPGISGALYAHNNSRNLLVPIAGWGGFEPPRDGFAPSQCWALRRGQSHAVCEPGSDVVCEHVEPGSGAYHCEPLLAGGEVIGDLHMQGVIDGERRFRLNVMAENIASALFSHRLQRGLREQTIRDPLTGLFNRRYLEETLALEIARSGRSGEPLSVVMCDVDHFKRFNDEFGHDAGDAVLQSVAAEMRARFRDGDVVCRYGGEEFTIIAPGTTADALRDRVEQVRLAIGELSLRQAGRTLGSVSMSFGIASWDAGMDRQGLALVQAADAALYEAKRGGRNRTVLTLRQAA